MTKRGAKWEKFETRGLRTHRTSYAAGLSVLHAGVGHDHAAPDQHSASTEIVERTFVCLFCIAVGSIGNHGTQRETTFGFGVVLYRIETSYPLFQLHLQVIKGTTLQPKFAILKGDAITGGSTPYIHLGEAIHVKAEAKFTEDYLYLLAGSTGKGVVGYSENMF